MKDRYTVLVTGGAGYIGSHTCVTLVEQGFHPVVIDNLSNGSRIALERVEEISGARIPFEEIDVRDSQALESILRRHAVDAVIHFAASKSVSASVRNPLAYYDNIVGGGCALLQAMSAAHVSKIVYSSSATVYGPATPPVTEAAPIRPSSPYGTCKAIVETMIRHAGAQVPGFAGLVLRYFNPIGAHASGMIGEDPSGTPENLMPYLTQVAVGRREHLNIFGSDWETPDGTGIRDYIHVMDVALAHVCALQKIRSGFVGVEALNIGTGCGTSVLELLRAFEEQCCHKIRHQLAGRRPGDIAALWADPRRAKSILGWAPRFNLADMCGDAWRWQLMNPNGYGPRERASP